MTEPNNNHGNNILLQLTMDKVRCFDSTNVGQWFDRIVESLTAATVSQAQIFTIIHQAVPETGQRQINFGDGEPKDLEN